MQTQFWNGLCSQVQIWSSCYFCFASLSLSLFPCQLNPVQRVKLSLSCSFVAYVLLLPFANGFFLSLFRAFDPCISRLVFSLSPQSTSSQCKSPNLRVFFIPLLSWVSLGIMWHWRNAIICESLVTCQHLLHIWSKNTVNYLYAYNLIEHVLLWTLPSS